MTRRFFWESGEPRVEAKQVSGWTLPAIVLQRALREPHSTVYRVPEDGVFRDVTRREMWTAASEIGVGLAELGVARGDRVAIIGNPSFEWVGCDLGTLVSGAIPVGIYQTSSAPEIGHILEDARPRVFIAQRREHLDLAIRAVSPDSSVEAFVLMEGELPAPDECRGIKTLSLMTLRELGRKAIALSPARAEELVALGTPEEIARIIYTSGTTGRPKGAVYTHRAWLLTGEQWVLRFPDIRLCEHRTVAFLSLAHVSAAVLVVVAPLVSRLVPHFSIPGASHIDMFKVVRPGVVGMTPRFFQKIAVELVVRAESDSAVRRWLYGKAMRAGNRMVRAHWNGEHCTGLTLGLIWLARRTIFRQLLATVGLDQVRRAQTGSSVMPTEVAKLWAIWGVDVREAYGLTEAACAVTYQQTPFPRPGSIGRLMTPQPGSELKLAPDGEILFKSPMIFAGYWNNPEATSKTIRDGWVYTGDLAEWTPDGNLCLIGRKNDAINTAGGKTINPTEIENELRVSPLISEAIVFGNGEKYLTALIELEAEAIQAWAQTHGIQSQSLANLSVRPEIEELIGREVANANERIGRVQQIKKFKILPEPLEAVPDALTSARKVKRRVVQERYRDLIDEMYDRSEMEVLSAHAGQY